MSIVGRLRFSSVCNDDYANNFWHKIRGGDGKLKFVNFRFNVLKMINSRVNVCMQMKVEVEIIQRNNYDK